MVISYSSILSIINKESKGTKYNSPSTQQILIKPT